MCTLTVLRTNGALTLTMNRDDAPARAEAPPRLWEKSDVRFAAPVDIEAGGTWIGVNADGVVACLLNRYDDAPVGVRSRGEIVQRALAAGKLDAATKAIGSLAHGVYSPFTCVIVSTMEMQRFDWNGEHFTRRCVPLEGPVMMTSSSWRFEAVAAWRQALFEKTIAPDPAARALSDFHCAQRPGEEAWAPMMQRDYAHTKSITQIVITMTDIEMRYWPREHAIERGLQRPFQALRLERANTC